MKLLYYTYQIIKIFYYAVFFLISYTALWSSFFVATANLGVLGYQHFNFIREAPEVQVQIMESKSSEDPHWLKIQKINKEAKKSYFFLPHLYSPFWYLLVSVFLMIPAFLVSSLHELVRKFLYYIEINFKVYFSHLLDNKEKK